MKNIMVHLDASPRAAQRLTLARSLAKRHGAELDVVYGVLPSMLASPWIDPSAASTVAGVMNELDNRQRARARDLYERLATDVPATWSDAAHEALQGSLLRHAIYADLLVLGQQDSTDRESGALPADLVSGLVVDSGRPSLVVPYAGSFTPEPDSILLAWKPTREAARAAAAALPWLTRAHTLHVASHTADDEEDPLPAFEQWLRRHEVSAPVRRHRTLAPDVGEGLLSLAAEVGAEMLVMGCYGHSRTREWVLGGATRTILQSMTVPVLMVH